MLIRPLGSRVRLAATSCRFCTASSYDHRISGGTWGTCECAIAWHSGRCKRATAWRSVGRPHPTHPHKPRACEHARLTTPLSCVPSARSSLASSANPPSLSPATRLGSRPQVSDTHRVAVWAAQRLVGKTGIIRFHRCRRPSPRETTFPMLSVPGGSVLAPSISTMSSRPSSHLCSRKWASGRVGEAVSGLVGK